MGERYFEWKEYTELLSKRHPYILKSANAVVGKTFFHAHLSALIRGLPSVTAEKDLIFRELKKETSIAALFYHVSRL